MSRSPHLALTAALALSLVFLLSACGGGGGAGLAAAKPTLDGGVSEVDGSTSDLDGVTLLLRETGEQAVTGADGSFDFGDVPDGSITIALVGMPAGVQAKHEAEHEHEHETEAEHEAEIEDGDDRHDDEVEIHRIHRGERIRLRLRIRDGRIERCDVSRSDHDEREVEVCLRRTDANDDPDMRGCLEIELRDDRARFEVEVEHATPGRDLELVVIAPDGTEVSLGVLTVDAEGEAEWELHASSLPFGVTSPAGLEGYRVEVRDAGDGTALLVGTVPELPPAAPPSDEDGDHHEDGDRMRGRARMTSHESGVEGYVEIRQRSEDGRQRFEIEAEHLAPGREVEFFLEDALGSGVFVSLGTRLADVEGEAELELDTGDGDALPFGVTDVGLLVGFAVEVRDAATGALILDGHVPALAHD